MPIHAIQHDLSHIRTTALPFKIRLTTRRVVFAGAAISAALGMALGADLRPDYAANRGHWGPRQELSAPAADADTTALTPTVAQSTSTGME